MLTLISHFWNEEFLLPYFIQQNRKHFDHAIFVDYDSTDRSREIIRALWPGAEIRLSRNRSFDAPEVDREVMEIERGLPGWKLALNTTEMLFHPDFRKAIGAAAVLWPDCEGFGICPIVMVDPVGEGLPLDSEVPLFAQRHHGWIDPQQTARSFRYIHRRETGDYSPGRHSVPWAWELPPGFFFQWWGWSPLPQTRERKLQIQQRLPSHDLYGSWHRMDEATFQKRWNEMNQWTSDLCLQSSYRDVLQRTCQSFGCPARFPILSED